MLCKSFSIHRNFIRSKELQARTASELDLIMDHVLLRNVGLFRNGVQVNHLGFLQRRRSFGWLLSFRLALTEGFLLGRDVLWVEQKLHSTMPQLVGKGLSYRHLCKSICKLSLARNPKQTTTKAFQLLFHNPDLQTRASINSRHRLLVIRVKEALGIGDHRRSQRRLNLQKFSQSQTRSNQMFVIPASKLQSIACTTSSLGLCG